MAKKYRRPVHTLAPYIGEVTIAWNDVQFALLYIFQELINDRRLAQALYFSAPSDRAQQRMVLEAIDAVLVPIDSTLAQRIAKQIRGLDKYVSRRNDVVHALWTTEAESLKLMPLQPKSSLRGKDIKTEMKRLAADLMEEAIELFMMRSRLFELQHFKNQALANKPLYEKDVFS